MRKKDRTAEEKLADKLARSGIMRLGAQPSKEAATSNLFPYVLFWDRLDRKGQKCRITKPGFKVVTLEFEDGFITTMNKFAIRRSE